MGDQVDEAHADDGNADHRQSHHGARLEGYVETGADGTGAGRRGAHVRADRDGHAHVTGDSRAECAETEGQGGIQAVHRPLGVTGKNQRDYDAEHEGDHQKGFIQQPQVGRSAFLDPESNLLSLLGAGILLGHPQIISKRCGDGRYPGTDSD